jgi:hypothetical protein
MGEVYPIPARREGIGERGQARGHRREGIGERREVEGWESGVLSSDPDAQPPTPNPRLLTHNSELTTPNSCKLSLWCARFPT